MLRVAIVAGKAIIKPDFQAMRPAGVNEIADDVAFAAHVICEQGDVVRGDGAVVQGDSFGVLDREDEVLHAGVFGHIGPLIAVKPSRFKEAGVLVTAGPIQVDKGSQVEMDEHAEVPRHEIALCGAQYRG